MGDSEFVRTTKLFPCRFTPRDVMAVAMRDLTVVVVRSANELEVFDIARSYHATLRRRSLAHTTITCVDVVAASSFIVTGGMTDTGAGELAVWQIGTGHELAILPVASGVTHVQFGASASEIVFADLTGRIAVASLTNFLIKFQLRLKPRFEREIGETLTVIRMYRGVLYVGTQTGTCWLDLTREGLPRHELDSRQTLAFGFCVSGGLTLMAQGVGHDIVVSTPEKHGDERVCAFEKTPTQVAVVDSETVVAMFPGCVEVVGPSIRMGVDVPRGISLADNGELCVVGDHIYRVEVSGRQKRVQRYVEEEKWDLAFRQILAPDEVADFYGLVNAYVRSDQFDAAVLFDVLERLNVTDYVVTGLLHEKRKEIIEALVDSGRCGWSLTLEFVHEILDMCKNEQSVTQFFKTVEVNLDWIDDILSVALNRGWYELAMYLVTTYMQDYYLQYLVAMSRRDFATIHEVMQGLLEQTDSDLVRDTLEFMENNDLTELVDYNEAHIHEVVSILVTEADDLGMDVLPMISNLIKSISKESVIWPLIADYLVEKEVDIDSSMIPYIENFVFFRKEDVLKPQKRLLLALLERKQLTDYRRYLDLTRMKMYVECEVWIVCQLHDSSEMITTLVSHNMHSFKTMILRVANGDAQAKQLLMSEALLFLSINADEFCEMVAEYCNIDDVRLINESFIDDAAATWQFQKRIFARKEFAELATPDEILSVTEQYCLYMKDRVLAQVRLFKDIPATRLLALCESHTVVDATLYLCDLMQDFARAKEFSKNVLRHSLMQTQNPQTVTKICDYLSSTSCEDEKLDMWLDVMESFQLPLYAHKDDPEKSMLIAKLLSQYMEAMVRDVKEPRVVAQRFTRAFGFLPFRTARSILSNFFRSVHEKFAFSKTLNDIVKCEAVQKQMSQITDIAAGHVYHADRCAGCGRRLGQGTVIGSHCGHVFHPECVRSGWCPICETGFQVPKAKAPPKSMAHLWRDVPSKKHGPPNPQLPPCLGTVTVC